MAKGYKSGGGSRAGKPNKATVTCREAIARFADANAEAFAEWVMEIPDPAKRCDVFLRAIEYHIPKLQRSEITGKDGERLTVTITGGDSNVL